MIDFAVQRFVDRAHAAFAKHVQNLKTAAEDVARLQLVPF